MMLKGIKTLLLEHEEGLAPSYVCKYLSRSANQIVSDAVQKARANKSNSKPAYHVCGLSSPTNLPWAA